MGVLTCALFAGCDPDPRLEVTAPGEACVGQEFDVGWETAGAKVDVLQLSGEDLLFEDGSSSAEVPVMFTKSPQSGSVSTICTAPGSKEITLSALRHPAGGGTELEPRGSETVAIECRECGCPDSAECRLDSDCDGGAVCDQTMCACRADTPDGGVDSGPDGGVDSGTDGGSDPTFVHRACDPPDLTGLTVPNAILEAAGLDHMFVANGYAGIQDKSVVVTMIDSCSDAEGCATSELRLDPPDPDGTDYTDFRPWLSGAVNACGDLLRAELALSSGEFVGGIWALRPSGAAPMSSVDALAFSDEARFGCDDSGDNLSLHVLEPSASEGVAAAESLDLGIAPVLYTPPFICDAAEAGGSRPGCFVFSTDTALSGDDTNGETDVYALADPAGDDFTPTRILEDADAVDVTPDNGRFVVVRSSADLDGESAGLSNDQVFVLDRDVSGDGVLDEASDTSIERVSNKDNGTPIGYVASWGTISDDGRFVTYVALPNGTAAGMPMVSYGGDNLFVLDRETGMLALVSATGSGEPANDDVVAAQITPDGRAVLFVTTATNLDADDTDPGPTLYIAPNPLAE